MKGTLMQMLPETRVYLVYKRPYFRVRVGNFIKPQDAFDFRDKHLTHLNKVYTVKDKIVYMWYPSGN